MSATQRTNPTAKPDIIVVGGGLAGVCAAIAATERNASVVVIDRASGGGSSAISGGVVYVGGGTRPQKEAGYDDDPANMFRYLRHEVGDAVDEATLRRFCDQSVANLDWLERHGARFSGSEAPYKTSYPTGGGGLPPLLGQREGRRRDGCRETGPARTQAYRQGRPGDGDDGGVTVAERLRLGFAVGCPLRSGKQGARVGSGRPRAGEGGSVPQDRRPDKLGCLVIQMADGHRQTIPDNGSLLLEMPGPSCG